MTKRGAGICWWREKMACLARGCDKAGEPLTRHRVLGFRPLDPVLYVSMSQDGSGEFLTPV